MALNMLNFNLIKVQQSTYFYLYHFYLNSYIGF